MSELRFAAGDLPQQTAGRTSLTLQVSAPLLVEVGLEGRYERRSIKPGDFCLTPAGGTFAAARWRGERHILVAELSPILLRSVAEAYELDSFELIPRHAMTDAQVTHPMLALREELLSGNPSGPAYVDMIARAIVVRLLRAHAVSAPRHGYRGGLSQPQLRRVIEYIEAHLDQELGLRKLALMSGLSEDHFARAFRRSAGVPPHRYVLRQRLARARQLRETSAMPIVEIAQVLGFADQSHLTNLFRRDTGMTPGQVRQARRNPENSRNPPKLTGNSQESEAPLELLS
jgi:AraC family transcriptional regulator